MAGATYQANLQDPPTGPASHHTTQALPADLSATLLKAQGRRTGGAGQGGKRHRQACPQLASPSKYWQECTNQGIPGAVPKPGQEDWFPKLCSSAPRTNRGSARKGSQSHASGKHWINATAVPEGSSGRALEALGTSLDPRAPALTPCASVSTSVHA